MLDPDLLRALLAVADTGGITSAANRLHRTQSAVSMQIKRLEDGVGRPLLARNGRGIRLTPDGEMLLGHARRILSAHEQAMALFRDGPLEGSVSLGMPDDLHEGFLPRVLNAFAESHPRIHVEVVVDASRAMLERMDRGELDMAIVSAGWEGRPTTELFSEQLIWVVAPHSSALERTPIPLAVYHEGCVYRRMTLEALGKAGTPYRVAYSTPSLAGIKATVRAGLAIASIPRGALSPGMRTLGPDSGLPPLPPAKLRLVRAIDEFKDPAVKAMHGHIVDSIASDTNPRAA